jgi:hypothetical protein
LQKTKKCGVKNATSPNWKPTQDKTCVALVLPQVPWKPTLKQAKKLPEWLPTVQVHLLVLDLCLWFLVVHLHLLLPLVQYK